MGNKKIYEMSFLITLHKPNKAPKGSSSIDREIVNIQLSFKKKNHYGKNETVIHN